MSDVILTAYMRDFVRNSADMRPYMNTDDDDHL